MARELISILEASRRLGLAPQDVIERLAVAPPETVVTGRDRHTLVDWKAFITWLETLPAKPEDRRAL